MHAEKYYELQVAYACWVETLKEGNCTNTCIILLFPSRQNTVNLTQETVSNAHGYLTETTIAAPSEVGWHNKQTDKPINGSRPSVFSYFYSSFDCTVQSRESWTKRKN